MKFYIAVVSFFDRSAGTVSSLSQKCQYAVPARTGTLTSYLNGEKQKWRLKFGQPCARFYYVLTKNDKIIAMAKWPTF